MNRANASCVGRGKQNARLLVLVQGNGCKRIGKGARCKTWKAKKVVDVVANVEGVVQTTDDKEDYHSSDIRNTSIFRRCSKRSIFKYLKKNIIKIQRLENWPLYQVFSSIF